MTPENPYATSSDLRLAALADVSERTTFIQRTYMHLAGAIIAFVVLEAIILSIFPPADLYEQLSGMLSGFGYLVFFGCFLAVSAVADYWARNSTSRAMQYAGLGVYVVAEAIFFLPLMALSYMIDPSGSIPMNAGIITGIVFTGLTAMVFVTRADFSWMGKFLWLAGLAALGFMVVSFILPGNGGLGLWFSVAMVGLAAGYILYETSNVLHHYRTDQYVAASLGLFASVALMLWYVMRILIALGGDD